MIGVFDDIYIGKTLVEQRVGIGVYRGLSNRRAPCPGWEPYRSYLLAIRGFLVSLGVGCLIPSLEQVISSVVLDSAACGPVRKNADVRGAFQYSPPT